LASLGSSGLLRGWGREPWSSVRDGTINRKPLMALLLLGPVLAGCSSASDLLSKDADWFSRSGRVFIRNVSIETPPLSADKPVTAEDLVSADGACPGMAPPPGAADANAQAGSPPPSTTGSVALGHTECDVVRGIGAPENVNLSNNSPIRAASAPAFTRSPPDA
jgi:hypothetical protein